MKPQIDSSSRSLAHAWIRATPADPNAQIAWVSALALVVLGIGVLGVRDPATFAFQPVPVPPFIGFEIPAASANPATTEPAQASSADLTPSTEWTPPPKILPADLPNGGLGLVPITPVFEGGKGGGVSGPPAQPWLGKPGPVPGPGVFRKFTDGQEAGFFPLPTYPRESRLRGESGTTRLRWIVKASGEVSDIQVVKPSGSAALDRAAVSTLRNQWRFQPGQVRRYESQFVFQLVD